ncbi:hypothetical protein ACTQ5P_09885 [Bacillota bacterium LCP21S3_G6]|jgi:hypothetical protein
MLIHKVEYKGSSKVILSIVTALNSLISSLKTEVPENAVFTDTTYKLTLEGNEIILEDSNGNRQSVTLPGTSGSTT